MAQIIFFILLNFKFAFTHSQKNTAVSLCFSDFMVL